MDNIFYLLSAHSSCIEGLCVTKRNNNVYITKDLVGFSTLDDVSSDETKATESELWIKSVEKFLDSQQWRDHSISFLLPAEDVTFRKIAFPFHERKKVEQALPFELEDELMGDLADSSYSVQVHPTTEQNSEALVLLMERKRLQQLQKLCLDRDLLIRNIDCAAFALYRLKLTEYSTQPETQDLFQIYLGGDEAFINTIKGGRLAEIKIFPNRIAELLQFNFNNTKNSLHSFLHIFSKDPDSSENGQSSLEHGESIVQLKEELNWLCAQFTLHLRIKNYSSESIIEIHGIFGPVIKWGGVAFQTRPFPLPEAQTFAERSGENLSFSASVETELSDEILTPSHINSKTPDTLEELMVEAKEREESEENTQTETPDAEHNSSEDKQDEMKSARSITPTDPQTSLLSMLERKHWGILGELRKQTELFLEPHRLSLYHESTPWKRFLARNRGTVAVAASLIIMISAGFVWQTSTKLELLKQNIARTERQVQTELRLVLPQTSASGVKAMLIELKEKIKNRKDFIENSKNFEKRDYLNLSFLKNISALLEVDTPFEVDSLEYAPERFLLSGTIDSYDRLQILKNNLLKIKEFKGKQIIESNRKSPEGIVYRISIELK